MSKALVQSVINGEKVEFLCEPRQSLLEVLREVLGLTGTKEACNNGNCGACSVILDGVLVNSCLVLAIEADGNKRELARLDRDLDEGKRFYTLEETFNFKPSKAGQRELDLADLIRACG